MNTSEISIKRILSAVERTPEITDTLEEIVPTEQEWSASEALHFSAVHRQRGTPVDIKVGLSEGELFWTRAISQRAPDLVPALFASGQHLAGFELAWKAVEHCRGGVLGPQWGGYEFEMLLEAGVAFQAAAADIQLPDGPVRLQSRTTEDVRGWLRAALPDRPPGPVQALLEKVEDDFAWVAANCETVTSHGDLHMCNAVTRDGPPAGQVLLIDFAVCRQPWAFEAARLQVLNSLDPKRPGFRDLVARMGEIREGRGLSTCPDLEQLSALTLAWYAAQMWHLIPARRGLPDYAKMLEAYLRAGVGV